MQNQTDHLLLTPGSVSAVGQSEPVPQAPLTAPWRIRTEVTHQSPPRAGGELGLPLPGSSALLLKEKQGPIYSLSGYFVYIKVLPQLQILGNVTAGLDLSGADAVSSTPPLGRPLTCCS